MTFTYPDNPKEVSLAFLERIDAEDSGRWYAQPKMDGWRRMAVLSGGKWTWRAKPAGSGELKPLPRELQDEFEGLDWPDGIGLDMEWIGTRMVEHKPVHALHVFDVFMLDGELCRWPAWKRMNLVSSWGGFSKAPNVHFVQSVTNPGMVELFKQQVTDPMSEGVVVRRADSLIIGNTKRCADSAHMLKIKYRNIRELKGSK